MSTRIFTRPLRADDAATVARLHAASWRIAYRDILAPEYLNSTIDADRLAVWTDRLSIAEPDVFGILVEVDQQPAGFAYVSRTTDPAHGNLLDNIHVAAGFARQGIGRHLFAALSEEIIRRDWSVALHLWVYDANVNARRFYDALGGARVGEGLRGAPDGRQIPAGRYFWSDVRVFLEPASDD